MQIATLENRNSMGLYDSQMKLFLLVALAILLSITNSSCQMQELTHDKLDLVVMAQVMASCLQLSSFRQSD